MAMIRSAPAMRAPWITESPTPPQPNTATDEPGATFAVLKTAPTPVVTPQPTSAAQSSGILGSILIRFSADTVAYSAIEPQPEKMLSGSPRASRTRGVPSSGVVSAFPCSRQSTGRPETQKRHLPHI
jgi:hypothetical protein